MCDLLGRMGPGSRMVFRALGPIGLFFCLAGWATPITVQAQGEATAAAAARSDQTALPTQLQFELLTGDGGVGERAQRWSQLFERQNVSLTIRRGRGDEKLETKEEIIGRKTRRVTVIGRMEKSGQLIFADRQFGEQDADKLNLWIRDLRTYGAQGSPHGQPLWGLTKAQFGLVFQPLAKPLKGDLQGESLETALGRFELGTYRLERSGAAAKLCSELPADRTVRQTFEGVTQGTALAAVLNEYGLGCYPHRMADGSVRLEVVTLAETQDVWPVGWPPDQPLNKLVPKYFTFTQIDIQKLPLQDVLDAAGDVIGARVFVDYAGLTGRGVKLESAVVTHPPKKTTWAMALKSLVFQVKGKPDIYVDEAGHPILWISPIGTRRAEDAAGPPGRSEKK